MDQAKPENKSLSGHQQECRDDTNLDRFVRLPDARLSQVPVKNQAFYAANDPASTAQPVRPAKFTGPAMCRSARTPATKSANTTGLHMSLWDSSDSDPH